MTDSVLKNLTRIVAVLTALFTFITGVVNMTAGFANKVTFAVDASRPGEVIGNKVSNANMWSGGSLPGDIFIDPDADPTIFTQYIQIMTATGGSAERDLFKDPYDRSVLNDYDFSPLIGACRKILELGAKPHIKTGAVPLKLTTDPHFGVFGVNVYPPDDYEQYYTYIGEIAKALVAEFGAGEVLTWRFGVLTEYENKDWFMAKSGDPHDSMVAFCKLYDYTVAALQDNIGRDVTVGAHSMTVADGLWDERDFIEHCAKGANYKTGAAGTRICFLNASFYDSRPGEFGDRSLPETVAELRGAAENAGLFGLTYGIDEGRILSGTKGAAAGDLNLRICGFTYQAGYDARLIKQMADNGIDYFSSWGMTTNGHWGGLPTVSYHVARRFFDMAGSARVPVAKRGGYLKDAEVEALAGYDEAGGTLFIMAYNFKNKLDYKVPSAMTFRVSVPQFDGKDVTVTKYVVDDDANFFDEWQEDRLTHGITDDCFVWSPDDPAIDTPTTLNAPWARDLYFGQLREKYRECAKLTPEVSRATVEGGKLTLEATAAPNAVVFFSIAPAESAQ